MQTNSERPPLAIDLFCGLGGWAGGFLAEGYSVVGFDLARHDYGTGGYPGQLVLQDVLTLSGAQFRDAAVIVASPPCQKYSYMAMPWTRAKELAKWYRENSVRIAELNALFDSCFRIQLEACKAAGRYIPMVIENVKGAQAWVGRAKANYGSYYLWGDAAQVGGAIVAGPMRFGNVLRARCSRGEKGRTNFHFYENTGLPSPSFYGADHEAAVQRAEAIKNDGGSWFAIGSPGQTNVGQNPDGRKVPGIKLHEVGFNVAAQRYREEQTKVGGDWFGNYAEQKAAGTISPGRLHGKGSDSRKAASAQIAKIPFPLARHIARCFKP